eukprot:1939098-Amphidinium_carterae.1
MAQASNEVYMCLAIALVAVHYSSTWQRCPELATHCETAEEHEALSPASTDILRVMRASLGHTPRWLVCIRH